MGTEDVNPLDLKGEAFSVPGGENSDHDLSGAIITTSVVKVITDRYFLDLILQILTSSVSTITLSLVFPPTLHLNEEAPSSWKLRANKDRADYFKINEITGTISAGGVVSLEVEAFTKEGESCVVVDMVAYLCGNGACLMEEKRVVVPIRTVLAEARPTVEVTW